MSEKTEKERLSVLEAQRLAHEDRHVAFEKVLEDSFGRIDKSFEDGSKKFAALGEQIGAMHTTLTNHCTATNHIPITLATIVRVDARISWSN